MTPSRTTAPHPTPQEFLTPAITKELEKSMEALTDMEVDDFFLDGEGETDAVDGPTHQPSHLKAAAPAPAAASTTATYSRPLIESSAEATAFAAQNGARKPPQAAQLKPSTLQTHRTWNAVHMEMQNNAKLPTFNLPVNRSNSLSGLQIPAPRGRRAYGPRMRRNNDSVASSMASSVSGDNAETPTGEYAPSSPIPKLRHNTMDPALKLDNETSEAIDEILRLNENDLNLSEMFFDEDRSSAALAYSCYGGATIPKSFDIPKIDSKSSLEEGTAALGPGAKTIAPRHAVAPQTKMYYTRSKPLPIPVLRGPSPTKPAPVEEAAKTTNSSNQTMAQAIATAAAIATTSPSMSGAKVGKLDKSTAAALSVQPTSQVVTGVSAASHPVAPAPAHSTTTAPVSAHPTHTTQARPVATIPARPSTTVLHTANPVSSVAAHPYTMASHPVAHTTSHPVTTAPPHPTTMASHPVAPTPAHPITTAPPHPTTMASHPPTAAPHPPAAAPHPAGHVPGRPPTAASHQVVATASDPVAHGSVRLPTATPHLATAPARPASTAPHPGVHSSAAASHPATRIPGHSPASHPVAPASARPSSEASHQSAPVSSIPARPHPLITKNPPPQSATPVSSSAPGHPCTTVNQPLHVAGTAPASTPYHPGSTYHRVAKPPISHAAAHATTKASLAYASAQRSSYGYGVDHRVVGVPAPAPNIRGCRQQPTTAAVRTHPVTGASYVPIYTNPTPAVKPAAAPAPVKPITTPEKEKRPTAVDTEDPAYERKKQRAKHARVRLNEAIEELAVAMELAGTQSKERFNHLSYSTSNLPPSDPIVANSNVLSKMMRETAAQAENAKKWDRPSFVGLSATIIHSLNAQCEGLMREVMHLRREKEIWRNDAASSVGHEAGNVSPDASSMYHGSCQTGSNAEASEHSSKRQKLGDCAEISGKTIVCNNTTAEEQRRQTIQEVSASPKVLSLIAAYLDPTTLCRCLCVSQQWISFNIFQNQQTWLRLCYQRFGSWSVRKWEGDEDDEDEAATTHASPSMDLYCRMVEKNVKPYSSLDGSVFLGGSSMDGIVSGWVTLVERSNGETSRSVVLTQSVDGKSHSYYSPIPVVELRVLIQNTGYSNGSIYIPDQQFSVDASTRRKGEKMLEVTGDDRFKRRIIHIEKAEQRKGNTLQRKYSMGNEMCQLSMFEFAVLSVHIHARGCSTTSKFCHRAKKIQILVSINGTTRPLVIPISGQR